MEAHHEYSRLKRTIYKFTKGDILDALCKEYKIKLLMGHEFDLYEDEDPDKSVAQLVINYEDKDPTGPRRE